MSDQQAYLERSLKQRAYDAAIKADKALEAVMRQNAAHGRLASGNSLSSFRSEALRIFEEEFASASKFACAAMERIDSHSAAAVTVFAERVAEMIHEKVVLCGRRIGVDDKTVDRQLGVIKDALQEKRLRVVDDFLHGMTGDERLKKDPVVSIVNSQTNNLPGLHKTERQLYPCRHPRKVKGHGGVVSRRCQSSDRL
ncbi:hypothetical protein [Bradyrhizobium diazoefficiens]